MQGGGVTFKGGTLLCFSAAKFSHIRSYSGMLPHIMLLCRDAAMQPCCRVVVLLCRAVLCHAMPQPCYTMVWAFKKGADLTFYKFKLQRHC